MKVCPKCGIEKPLFEFHKNKKMSDGLQVQCKGCHRQAKQGWQERNRKKANSYVSNWGRNNPEKAFEKRSVRRKHEKQAVPLWFEKDFVATVYNKAAELGFQVDHVVPIKSPLVCGLHCWANLQLLDKSLNASKSNREWPDMP